MFEVVIKLSRFVGDAAGLEKTLRLLQALTQIVAAYSLSLEAAVPWLQARKQFALGRRYLRFVKFVDAFTHAYATFSSGMGLLAVLESGKWSCLGMYLFLESCTILDAMGVVQTTWAADLFVEANKFWFCSLILGILGGLMELSGLYSQASTVKQVVEEKDGKPEQAKAAEVLETRTREEKWGKIMKKMVTDACDLFLPGSAVGWIPVSSANVGMLTVVSTLLPATDIWARVQSGR